MPEAMFGPRILKLTSYGRDADPWARYVEEVVQDPDGSLRVRRSIVGRDGVARDVPERPARGVG